MFQYISVTIHQVPCMTIQIAIALFDCNVQQALEDTVSGLYKFLGENIPENCVFLDIKAKILAKKLGRMFPQKTSSVSFFFIFQPTVEDWKKGAYQVLCICYLYYFLSYVFFLFCKAGETRVYVSFPNNVSICDFFLNCNTYLIYSTYAISLQYVCNTMCNLHHSVSTIINY